MIQLNDPTKMIETIKESMKEIMEENNLTEFLGFNMEDLFRVYSSDFCEILLYYFPEATLLMKNNYLECGILINDLVYDSSGVANKLEYDKATMEDIRFISRSFKHLSSFVFEKLMQKVNNKLLNNHVYVLRKGEKK